MLVKITPARLAAGPPGRRPDPGPKNSNASPGYFISRANDFSEHRRRVERSAGAARRTRRDPRHSQQRTIRTLFPAAQLPAGAPSDRGSRASRRGSGRPTGPPRGAREQGHRSAGSSQVDPMAGLPSRKGNIPAPGLRAHSHRSTGHRHSGSPTSIMPGQSPRFAIPDKQAFAVNSPCVASAPAFRVQSGENEVIFLEHRIQIGSRA